jgi:HlyD family secretion protein
VVTLSKKDQKKGAHAAIRAAWAKAVAHALVSLVAAVVISGCSKSGANGWQGYIEGEFVYVASPLGGRLDKLLVAKGSRVAAGAPLFELEHVAETAALQQAARQLEAAKAQLEDLKKGSRPEEIAAIQARLGQARAAAELSRLELARQEALFKAAAISASDFDRARLTHVSDTRAVDEEQAKLETARLGGRPDAVEAAVAAMRAAADAESRARWSVDQKAQAAPTSALVFDTLYREGEFVAAGSPVVALLPPANVKVRFFVPEPQLARVKGGDHVNVRIEGLPSPLEGVVSYISPQPEYTPPVLYNQDNRAKLVYMVEAVFPEGAAADLHPGQPVFVRAPAQ